MFTSHFNTKMATSLLLFVSALVLPALVYGSKLKAHFYCPDPVDDSVLLQHAKKMGSCLHGKYADCDPNCGECIILHLTM